ncbi:hypothetical protein [Actinocatenispora comari]|nr:hypothetical protein [Actinocatenispora comari]
MRKVKACLLLAPVAAFSMPFVASTAASAAPATNYSATLNPLNHASGSGMLSLTMNGNKATVTEHVSGLAATFMNGPYPHVQHIHIGAQGKCPTAAADKNGDGVVDTAEGQPSYGAIGTTLSTKGDTSPKAGTDVKIAPGGGSFDYSRTITLDAKTMSSVQAGTAVIVVHGLDPTTLSKKAQGEKSNLVPSLPLAATSPALCGPLTSMPAGGAATGGGSTSGVEDVWMFVAGGAALTAAGAALVLRRLATSTH